MKDIVKVETNIKYLLTLLNVNVSLLFRSFCLNSFLFLCYSIDDRSNQNSMLCMLPLFRRCEDLFCNNCITSAIRCFPDQEIVFDCKFVNTSWWTETGISWDGSFIWFFLPSIAWHFSNSIYLTSFKNLTYTNEWSVALKMITLIFILHEYFQ